MSDLARLAKPFAKHLVQRAPQGKHGDFVSHSSVNEKLLAVLGPFDFSVGELIRDKDGDVVGCYGTITCTIDGRVTSVTEIGCFDGFEKENDGDRAKKAASDAFKRCAMRLGVGLHLWSQDAYFLFDVLSKQEGPVVVPAERSLAGVAKARAALDGTEPFEPAGEGS